MSEIGILVLLGLYWAFYCLLHSFLASNLCKSWLAGRFPNLVPAYRLGFNALAVLLLAPAAVLMGHHQGPPLWQWRGPASWIADGLALAAAAGFLASLRSYDLGLFLGLRQWRERRTTTADLEELRISFWHRFVRHPWYFFALVLLWTREMNAAQLLSAALISIYLAAGSRLEEEKLCRTYGKAYRLYRQRVPGVFPLPWRRLNGEEARELEALSRRR